MIGKAGFWLVGATFSMFLFAAAAPSPLYGLYAATWHFSAITLTEVFAIYALALLAALLFTGSLSDALGRRPVILAALLVQAAAMVLFLLASDVSWLFAARVAQGAATGIATSALAAALVDLQPARAPLVNSVAPILGLALGALAAAALVQYAPDPLHLVYWLMLAAFLAAALATALMREPASSRRALNLMPRVGVEPAARGSFFATLPMLVAGWSVGSFYLSLGPTLTLLLLHSTNRLWGGIAIFLLAGVGALTTIVLRTWPPPRAMVAGGVSLVAGLALGTVAVALSSGGLFLVATGVAGIGFGLGWLGVLRTLVALASPTGRGALLAAIYIVAYLAFALPAVVAGFFVTKVGLHDAALGYAAAVGILALIGLGGALGVSGRTQAA